MKDIKFVILIILIFFGAGIMANINDYDYNVNKTGIMYQENDNIVLNENNRFYDYDIDFDLDKSYLQYNPVKKSGLLDSLYSDKSKNLAVPYLTGKEYLGDGWYQLYKTDTRDYRYNVFNGYWFLDGLFLTQIIWNTHIAAFDLEVGKEYIASFTYIQGTTNVNFRGRNGRPIISVMNSGSGSWVEQKNGSWDQSSSGINEELVFKLQIEEGTTVTSYEVPYIPGLQIAFNGTNQVEYINPFEEQIIKIDDINNVNNIDFQLLNTKNPAVFNWNITTNPNMPFVRFYNNQTKLLYDFTDINEINNIGNELLGSRSNFMIVFESAIDTVDMFYTGFQRLFNRRNIEFITNSLKKLWPIITPNWPWLR